jgi:hypothetical protein
MNDSLIVLLRLDVEVGDPTADQERKQARLRGQTTSGSIPDLRVAVGVAAISFISTLVIVSSGGGSGEHKQAH